MKIFDGPFEYEVRWKAVQPRCDLRIYKVGRDAGITDQQSTYVVVFSQPEGYEGLSVTNGAEKIASALSNTNVSNGEWKRPERVLWVERYPQRGRRGNIPESFDLVTFTWHEPDWESEGRWVASRPVWQRVSRTWLEELIGEEF